MAGVLLSLAALTGCSSGSAATASATVYVAIGDSYVAAPFSSRQTGTVLACGQTEQNYPRQVARGLGLDAAHLRDVSCSGAATRNVAEAQGGLLFGASNPPQRDGLGPAVGLVTITLGGNDIGFDGILRRCVQTATSTGPCANRFHPAGGSDELAARIAALGPRLDAVLASVAAAAPRARVFVVGYPYLLPLTGDCGRAVPLLAADQRYLAGVGVALNDLLRQRATAAGAGFVDVGAASIGHDLCQPAATTWLTSLTPGTTLATAALAAHPNLAGTTGQATAVLAALSAAGFTFGE